MSFGQVAAGVCSCCQALRRQAKVEGNAEAAEALLALLVNINQQSPQHQHLSIVTYCSCSCADGKDAKGISVQQLLDSVPAAAQQDALRGKALAVKQQGNAEAAEALLKGLVNSEQQIPQVQHLVQADYGVLLRQQGNLTVRLC